MKTKKIISIVVSSIVLLFAIFVLVSAFIPKNFNVNLASPDRITIYNADGTQAQTYYKDEDEFNKIMNLYNKGFKTSFMQSFFQGKSLKKVQTVDSSSAFNASQMKDTKNVIYIEFSYNNEQETVKHGSNVEFDTDEKNYRHVVIEIKNSQVLSSVNAYIIKGNDVASSYSYIKYTSYASHNALYKYLSEGILA